MLENGNLVVLNMQDILPNRFQPRIHFDDYKLAELAESIRKYGVIQPIVVRQIGSKYEIIAGERRYKASTLANKATIPAIIVNLSDRESEEIALLENVQRQNLTAIEEAVSYKRILDMGYITQEELARKLGKSQSTIANKIRLLNLDDQVQDALLRGKISERHARSLLRLHNKNEEVLMLSRIINERLTVKRTDEEINKILESRGGVQKVMITSNAPIETLDIPPRKAVPVGSHQIIRVNPPKELTEKIENKSERRQGFMDIDRILQEAQDINTEPVTKQPSDISELMKQNPNTVVSEPIRSESVQETVTPVLSENNKFVNFGGMLRKEVSEPAKLETPEVNNTVSFDSIFNQRPVEAAPLDQPMPAQPRANNVQMQSSTLEQPTMTQPNMNVYQSVQPLYSQNQQSVNQSPMISQNTQSNQQSIQNGQYNNLSFDSRGSFTNQGQQTGSIPSSDIFETRGGNQMPSMVNQPVKPVQPSNEAHRLMQAINMIRKCAKEIENLGFFVDVDEINLDNSYQVTFKINKD